MVRAAADQAASWWWVPPYLRCDARPPSVAVGLGSTACEEAATLPLRRVPRRCLVGVLTGRVALMIESGHDLAAADRLFSETLARLGPTNHRSRCSLVTR